MQNERDGVNGRGEQKQERTVSLRVRAASWLNAVGDLAAFAWGRLNRLVRGPQARPARIVALGVILVVLVGGLALVSQLRTSSLLQELAGSDGAEGETKLTSDVGSDGFSRGRVTLGLGEEELRAQLGLSGEEAAQAMTRQVPQVPENLSEEALGALNLSKLQWPVHGEVTTEFGWWRHPLYGDWRMHPGICIETPPGSAVSASIPGRVAEIRHDNYLRTVVVIEHGGQVRTVYGNLQHINVSLGTAVAQGQVIGRTAPKVTDTSRGELYFEVRHRGEPVNPAAYLP